MMGAGANIGTGGLNKTEWWVLKLRSEGKGSKEISAITGMNQTTVLKIIGYESEASSLAQNRNIKAGTKALGKAIDFVGGAKAFAENYTRPRMTGGTLRPPCGHHKIIKIRNLGAVNGDARPPAPNREPCPRCQTRGDLGCDHQRPFTPETALA